MKGNVMKNEWYAVKILAIYVGLMGTCTYKTYGNQDQWEWITVFVHGIMSVKPHLGVRNFIRFVTDSVDNTIYSETVRLMREDPIFFKNQAMLGVGLQKIDARSKKERYAAGALADSFDTVLRCMDEGAAVKNHYYTFGWSGLLSPSNRYKDAIGLYRALSDLVKQFKTEGKEPKIRLVGYSHGGNVLLNLALVPEREQLARDLVVNELILLGMPVQHETDYLINDQMFKTIYHIYSESDRIQKLDFFSLNRFFSRRVFKSRSGFDLPDKLIQIQLHITRPSRHIRNDSKKMAKTYDLNNSSIISGKSRFLRNSSPGHSELWFFGWTPVQYRKKFPLSPLPVATFLPFILHYTRDFQRKDPLCRPTLIDIRPDHEMVLIKNKKSRTVLSVVPFLSHDQRKKLRDIVCQYQPVVYTSALYNGAITDACSRAKDSFARSR